MCIQLKRKHFSTNIKQVFIKRLDEVKFYLIIYIDASIYNYFIAMKFFRKIKDNKLYPVL